MSIGYETFRDCRNLTSVNIPDSVTSIGSAAFENCSSLTSANIPDGVTNIGYETFRDCSSLLSISIPSSVTSIDSHAFSGCKSLKDVYYAGSLEQWEQIEVVVGNEDLQSAVIHCTSSGSDAPEVIKKAQTIMANDIVRTYSAKKFFLGASSSVGAPLSYAVSDPKVAAVDGNGKVTLKGCGIVHITVTAAETDAYFGTQMTIKLTVKPKKMAVASVKSKKRKAATVKWKKDGKVSGYLIECATDKKFKKNKAKAEIKKNKTVTVTIKKLKPGKKYYVRICAYVKSGKDKIQGDWSKMKTVKVKK